MDIIEDIDDPAIPIARACEALGVSRASVYRCTTPPRPPSYATRAPSPRRLGEDERNAILDVLHSERFADQPPPEVYAALLSQGVYMASIRTMYRLLAEQGENADRRAQRAPVRHVKPTLSATAPNQVWTWDITKLRSVVPGVMFCLYVIIDLFSRMVVGWLLAERENGAHAERLFAETIARHGVSPGALTVHADRGSPMKSEDLAQLFALLGVARSFSRPHVSDDNAFSEAQFKTLKYQPDYPSAFASMRTQGRGARSSSGGSMSITSTRESRSSRPQRCFTGASRRSPREGRLRSMVRTRQTPSDSRMVGRWREGRLRRCISIRCRSMRTQRRVWPRALKREARLVPRRGRRDASRGGAMPEPGVRLTPRRRRRDARRKLPLL